VPAQERARRKAIGIVSQAAVPILRNGHLVATLSLADAKPRAWTSNDLKFLQETAERTWDAMERARAEDALHEASRRKDEFLATLAHELRNPLAPIRNGLQIIRMGGEPEPMVLHAVAMMERQLAHLVRLVDDLLDVGRISTGKIELRRAPVALAQVVGRSLEATRATFEQHGLELSVELPSEELVVEGDLDRLSQVFTNLLVNAAKYSDPGGRVRLAAGERRRPGRGAHHRSWRRHLT
jgi:signal transduction histidine kinase